MATSLGTLSVNLVANTKKLINGFNDMRKKLDEARARAKKTKESMQALQTKTQKAGVAARLAASQWRMLAGVLSAGAFVRAMTATAENLDRLAKTSAKLGIASEQLAGLRHAANQTGVATSTLDMALQRFARRAAEAANDTGEAKDAIKALGIDAKELVKIPLERQIALVADKMRGLTSDQERLRIAFKLFDSEGVVLVNTLRLGSDGLAKMQAEAVELGLAMSGKNLKRVETFNDELDKLKKQFGGELNKLLIDITPAATEAIHTLRIAMQTMRNNPGYHSMSSYRRNYADPVRNFLVGADIAGDRGFRSLQRTIKGRHDLGPATQSERGRFVPSPESLDYYGGRMPPMPGRDVSGPMRELLTMVGLETWSRTQPGSQNPKRGTFSRDNFAGLRAGIAASGIGLPGIISSDRRDFLKQQGRNEAATIAAVQGAMFGMFSTMAGMGAPKTMQDFSDISNKRKAQPRQDDNSILLRGTAEAAKALRANLNREKKNPVVEINKKIEKNTSEMVAAIGGLKESLMFEVVG